MIDLRTVKKIVEMLDESSCDSIEISTEKGLRIKVSKATPAYGVLPPHPAVAAMPLPPAPEYRLSPAAGVPALPPPEAPPPAPKAAANLAEVKSPMVGTFYGAQEPGAKPFVSVGSRVTKGQVLCIIEAMKIMNEIESEVAGTVVEVNATDAHPVEYGQVLFRVNPNG